MLTCGSPELTRRTTESVSWLSRVEVVDVRRTPGAGLLGAAASAAQGWRGRSLVLVEGDVVDEHDIAGALASGAPRRDPVRLTPPSIAGDAARLPGQRLFSGGELLSTDRAAPPPVAPGDAQDDEDGAPWHLQQVPVAVRVTDDGWAEWARRRAVRLSRGQLDGPPSEAEALWLAELLLLARERDAVLVRARTALAGPLSGWARTRWVEAGLAAAVTGPREAETTDFAEALVARPGAGVGAAARSAWRAVAAERVFDFATAARSWRAASAAAARDGDDGGDPWMHLATGRRGTPDPDQVAHAARSVMAQRPTRHEDLGQLAELWRGAGLPAGELVLDWPHEHLDVLLGVATTATGSAPAWRLDLLDALVEAPALPHEVLVDAAAPLAARAGRPRATVWSHRAERLGAGGPPALEVRSTDPFVVPAERVLAAALWWRARRGQRAELLERSVAGLHPDDVEEVLQLLHQELPDELPHVLDLLCRDAGCARAVERLIGAGVSA